jgi:hypothetical protein
MLFFLQNGYRVVDVAGIAEIDLANVAKTFTALLAADTILNDESPATVTNANTESWHRVVPDKFLVAGQSPNILLRELHIPPVVMDFGSTWEATGCFPVLPDGIS